MAGRDSSNKNQATLIALIFLLAIGAGLLALTAFALPSVLGIVAVVFGMFVFGVFHYVVWGWWLGGYIRRLDERNAVLIPARYRTFWRRFWNAVLPPVPMARYRTFWRRFGAWLIDGLVFVPLYWVNEWVWGNVSNTPVLVVWFIVLSLSAVAYSIFLHGLFGQTLGKRITGVRVLNVAESRLGMQRAVWRDSVLLGFVVIALASHLPTVSSGLAPYAPEAYTFSDLKIAANLLYAHFVWFMIEVFSMLFSAKRRAVHDLIAGSVVVRVKHAQTSRNQAARAE